MSWFRTVSGVFTHIENCFVQIKFGRQEIILERVYQIVSPISNSESTNFSTNISYDFFFNYQTEKKNCFEPIRILFRFSTAQTEKDSWKKFRETNWWNHLMNPTLNFIFVGKDEIVESRFSDFQYFCYSDFRIPSFFKLRWVRSSTAKKDF